MVQGGIGKGIALRDRLAETLDELMFLEGEELTILLLMDPKTTPNLSENLRTEKGLALAYCEQVVGLVRVSDVKLTTRLKRPVISNNRSQLAPPAVIKEVEKPELSPTDTIRTLSPSTSIAPSPPRSTSLPSTAQSPTAASSSFESPATTSSSAFQSPVPSSGGFRSPKTSATTPESSPRRMIKHEEPDEPEEASDYGDDNSPELPSVPTLTRQKSWTEELASNPHTPPLPAATQQQSYFDMPITGNHMPPSSADQSISSLASSGGTPALDRILDVYARESVYAHKAESPPARPVERVLAEEPADRPVSEMDAAVSLGQLLLDHDSGSGSDDSESDLARSPRTARGRMGGFRFPDPAASKQPASRSVEPAALVPPETELSRGVTVVPPSLDSPKPLFANLSPLRLSRSQANLTVPAPTLAGRGLTQNGAPTASVAAQPQHSLRSRSNTFSQSLAHRPNAGKPAPPPVQVATSKLAAFTREFPSQTPSSGLSARPVLSPLLTATSMPASAPPMSNSELAQARKLDAPSPPVRSGSISRRLGFKSSSATSEPRSPRASSPKNSIKGVWSPKLGRRSVSSTSSASPSSENVAVTELKVNNVEFEMVTAAAAPGRTSFDSSNSASQSAFALDTETLDSDFITRPSPEARQAIRASMLLADASSEGGYDFYATNPAFAQSSDSISSPGHLERSSSLKDSTNSLPSSPADFRSLESHRSREIKWVSMIQTSVAQQKKGKKLKGMVRAGIPASVRAKAWCWLAEVDSLRQVGLYHSLCEKSSPVHEEIEANLPSCMPPHQLFAPSNSPARVDLLSVLKAFACHEPSIGFNRELGYVAGVLLLQSPAEDVFWLLVALTRRMLPDLYDQDQDGLREAAFVCGHLVAAAEPELAKRMAEAKIHPSEWSASWLLPLFSKTLPWDSLLRILDCFFLEGSKLIYRVTLALFDILKPQLMSCPPAQMLEVLVNPPRDGLSPPSDLLSVVFTLKIKDGQLRRLARRAEVVVRQGRPKTIR